MDQAKCPTSDTSPCKRKRYKRICGCGGIGRLGGERWERRRWRKKRPERVAAVDRRKPASPGEAAVGHRNRTKKQKRIEYADVVELVDSVDLGSSGIAVQVRVLSSAPYRVFITDLSYGHSIFL